MTVNRRLVLATVAVSLLILTAGCTMLFGGISDETLDEDQEYDDLKALETDAAIEVEEGSILSGSEYRAVYDLNDTDELSLYQSTFYTEVALDIRAVRYWYPNGTELTGSEIHVDQGRTSTEVQVPDGNGTIAWTGEGDRRSFTLEAFVHGSYTITLPEGHRTTNFLFGSANPGGYEREIVDDQEVLTWDHLDSTIGLQFYQDRNLPIFAGVVLVLVTVGGAGLLYYRRQVQQLEEQRKEMGLDVELEDDDDDRKGPPPGL